MVFKEFLLKGVKNMVRRLKLLVDFVAMVSVLSACSCVSNKAVSEGVGVVMKDGLDKVMGVESTLLDAYIKCGEMNFTGKVFDEMAEKNVVSWNSMKTPSSSNHPVAAEEVDADGESSSTIANCVDRGLLFISTERLLSAVRDQLPSFFLIGSTMMQLNSLLLTDVEFSGLVCRQLFNFSKVHVAEKMVGGVATLKIEQ
ncbi:hypothetical protein OIU78_018211 [Salix suchowensis]|nr:hypothetical protein OIU78_018211 [Salix suchowensis]